MNNFEYFVENCRYTKYFDCQIVLRDYTLLLIEYDFKALSAVEVNDVLFFMGVWEHPYSGSGEKTEADRFAYITSDYRNKDDDDFLDDYWYSPEDFNVDLLHALFDMGVDVEIIESYIPRLFEVYDAMARQGEDELIERAEINSQDNIWREWENNLDRVFIWNYKVFLMNWDGWVDGWRKKCDLMLGMSAEDKALFKQVEKLVREYCPAIYVETPPGCQWEWCKTIWDIIQLVRNDGTKDEVRCYLSENDLRSDNEFFQKWYEQQHMEAAEKLIKLIREG